jgi:hypothetical protein
MMAGNPRAGNRMTASASGLLSDPGFPVPLLGVVVAMVSGLPLEPGFPLVAEVELVEGRKKRVPRLIF